MTTNRDWNDPVMLEARGVSPKPLPPPLPLSLPFLTLAVITWREGQSFA